MAIGRSYALPSFLTSAGAKLMVVIPVGTAYPLSRMAERTRSTDSLTAVSGSPTIVITVEGLWTAVSSMSTPMASMP